MSLQSDKYLLFVSLCHKLCCETFFFKIEKLFSIWRNSCRKCCHNLIIGKNKLHLSLVSPFLACRCLYNNQVNGVLINNLPFPFPFLPHLGSF